jgi:CRISPR/Cas system-associated endoribonuclease Cas2
MKQKLAENIPDRVQTSLLQAHIDASLHERVKEKIEKLKKTKKVNLKFIVEMALRRWINEE